MREGLSIDREPRQGAGSPPIGQAIPEGVGLLLEIAGLRRDFRGGTAGYSVDPES